jgi:hypothetical protein
MSDPSPASERKNFPIARAVWRFARKRLRRWLDRHQLPFNFWLHMVGIPMAFTGVGLWFYAEWLWGTVLFVLGYLLQYVGHRAEGNDVGEWAAIKALFGLPCVAVSPRWQQTGEQRNAS